MIGRLSKNFHGVGIGPLSKILAVKREVPDKYRGRIVSKETFKMGIGPDM